jgi:glycine dehydrogenase
MSTTAFYDQFIDRHIGPNAAELQEMLTAIGVSSLDQLIEETVPSAIRLRGELALP